MRFPFPTFLLLTLLWFICFLRKPRIFNFQPLKNDLQPLLLVCDALFDKASLHVSDKVLHRILSFVPFLNELGLISLGLSQELFSSLRVRDVVMEHVPVPSGLMLGKVVGVLGPSDDALDIVHVTSIQVVLELSVCLF